MNAGPDGRAHRGTVLALDTSADIRVGLARDGEVLARGAVTDTRRHVEDLNPVIARVFAEADVRPAELDLVCVGLGPGPFTGLRVGIVAGQVLAAATGADLHGVCSLDVVAAEAALGGPAAEAALGGPAAEAALGGPAAGEFLVAADARRKELYWARYDATGRRVEGPNVGPPADLPELPLIGPGVAAAVELAPDLASRIVTGPRCVDAGLLAIRNHQLPSAGVEPLYLRRPDAAVSTRRKSTLVSRPPRLRRRGMPR